jgi:hypothetical protein
VSGGTAIHGSYSILLRPVYCSLLTILRITVHPSGDLFHRARTVKNLSWRNLDRGFETQLGRPARITAIIKGQQLAASLTRRQVQGISEIDSAPAVP